MSLDNILKDFFSNYIFFITTLWYSFNTNVNNHANFNFNKIFTDSG